MPDLESILKQAGVVADRLVGRLVFTLDGEMNRALTEALSSLKDIVADSARKALDNLPACPFQVPAGGAAREAVVAPVTVENGR